MKIRYLVLSAFLLLAILATACSPQSAPAPEPAEEQMVAEPPQGSESALMEEKDAAMMADEDQSDLMMDEDIVEIPSQPSESVSTAKDDVLMDAKEGTEADRVDEVMGVPNWFTVPLVDARTGNTFTISDFKGKVVLVETLAMWCSNCFKQQGQVLALHQLVGARDDFVSLGIDIDPNENAEALQAYVDKNGFAWLYAIAPKEVAREIGQLYGDQFLNPPSTPMLIIDRQGAVHLLPFGIKSAESLLEALQPFLDAEI